MVPVGVDPEGRRAATGGLHGPGIEPVDHSRAVLDRLALGCRVHARAALPIVAGERTVTDSRCQAAGSTASEVAAAVGLVRSILNCTVFVSDSLPAKSTA